MNMGPVSDEDEDRDWTKAKSYGNFPWRCNDPDCEAVWHKSGFEWSEEEDNQLLRDEFGDGAWEPIDEEDLPTHLEELIAWRDYALWAYDHGQDPLKEFWSLAPKQIPRKWRFKFRLYAGKVWLTEAIDHKNIYRHPRHLPPYAWDFLGLRDEVPPPEARLDALLVSALESWEELKAARPEATPNRYLKFSLMETVHPSEDEIKAHLRKMVAARLRAVRKGLTDRRTQWKESKTGFWSDDLERAYRGYRIPRARRNEETT